MSFKFKLVYLDTTLPELPKIMNDNFRSAGNYMDVFYDSSNGVIIAPVDTTGIVKSARGQFVSTVTDNLTVRRQYTNLYQNTTTADDDYYQTLIGPEASTRIADPSTFENQDFRYIDVADPYYKIGNDASIAFLTQNLSQEIHLIFDSSVSTTSPYTILMDASKNGITNVLTVDPGDASTTWLKLIALSYDPSWGNSWIIKQYGGSYTISSI